MFGFAITASKIPGLIQVSPSGRRKGRWLLVRRFDGKVMFSVRD